MGTRRQLAARFVNRGSFGGKQVVGIDPIRHLPRLVELFKIGVDQEEGNVIRGGFFRFQQRSRVSCSGLPMNLTTVILLRLGAA